MTNMEEVWRSCYFSNFYEVSNFGRIRSWKKHGVKDQLSEEPKYIKTRVSKDYEIFNARFDGTRKTLKVHRCMAFAFIKNSDPKNKTQVNHIDGVKTNNSLNNLEWCTPSQNQIHAITNGLTSKKFGENHWNSNLDDITVLTVITLIPFISCSKISKYTKTNPAAIQRIRSRQTFSHLPEPIGKYQQYRPYKIPQNIYIFKDII